MKASGANRSSRMFESSILMSQEERARFERICQDIEVQKILPILKKANFLIIQKTSTLRFAKLRPLSALAASAAVCENADEINSRINDLEMKGEKLDMVLCELDSGAPKVCELLRERCLNEDTRSRPLVPCLLFLPPDPSASLHATLQSCLDLGSPGFLPEPAPMGQLILTAGLILKQYEMIQLAYKGAIVKEEGKSYPRFDLAGVDLRHVQGLERKFRLSGVGEVDEDDLEDAEGAEIAGLGHVSEDQRYENRGAISSPEKRLALHRFRPSTTGSVSAQNFSLGFSAEMKPHIVKDPPTITSPRSACGLSRSKVTSALKYVKMKDINLQKKRMIQHSRKASADSLIEEYKKGSAGRGRRGAQRSPGPSPHNSPISNKRTCALSMQRRKEIEKTSLGQKHVESNEDLELAAEVEVTGGHLGPNSPNSHLPKGRGGPTSRLNPKSKSHRSGLVTKQHRSGIVQHRSGMLRNNRGSEFSASIGRMYQRKNSMEAPVRATIALKMVKRVEETVPSNNVSAYVPSEQPLLEDFNQYKMIEIFPPFNKSSRTCHFVSSGYKLYLNERYYEALNTFTKAIEVGDKAKWMAYFWRGIVFDKLKSFVRSLRDFTESIKLRTRLFVEERGDGDADAVTKTKTSNYDEEPKEIASIFYNRAIVYTHTGDDSSALADFDSAIKRDPSNVVFRHNRALVLRRDGLYKEAEGDYIKLWMERVVNRVDTSPWTSDVGAPPSNNNNAVDRFANDPMIAKSQYLARPHTTKNMSDFHKETVLGLGNGLNGIQDFIEKKQRMQEEEKSNNDKMLPSPKRGAIGSVKSFEFEDVRVEEKSTKVQSLGEEGEIDDGTVARNLFQAPQHDVGDVMEQPSTLSMPSIFSIPSQVVNDDDHVSSLNPLMQDSILTMESSDVFGSHASAGVTEVEGVRTGSPGSLRLDDDTTTVNFLSPVATVKSRRPHTTGGRMPTRGVAPSFMTSRTPESVSLDRSIHAIDARQLTDMYGRITETAKVDVGKGKEKGKAATTDNDKESSKVAKKGRRNRLQRVDLNEFKNRIGLKEDVHPSIFHKPTRTQLSLLKEPEGRKREDIEEIMETLKATDLCRTLGEEALHNIAENVEYRSVNKGDFIFQQGEPVDCCCILLSGKVVTKAESTQGVVVKIGEVDEGQNFGDEWLLMSVQGTSPMPISHQSYIAQSPCQLLVILQEHFHEYCASVSSDNLRARGRALAGTGLFTQWSNKELFDLACLAQTRKFNKGVDIVTQDQGFEYFCVLTKGLCVVTKFADRMAQVRRVLEGLKKDLKNVRLNYKFHHTMVDRAMVKSDRDGYFDIEGDEKPFKTFTEEEQSKLEKKIETWENKMRIIQSEEGDTAEKRLRVGGLVSNDIFGESSVLEPFKSIAEGSVTTDTNCEVIMVHKTILQRYHYTCTDFFREGVDKKAILYPNDTKLIINLKEAEDWLEYKLQVMKKIKKTRWPVNRRRIREVRGGTVITKDLETKFTEDNVM
ncbi:hypothetical protein TrVE_jg7067 [Triparma verrucosa]|uniref:Cyclic nucleotide-binding domain-containing protein n=1 Tax=Triparma verrucosa TaxID=1606542 RepID=A0A9W7EU23_9STRA|nr:hypothetical protein TrVE_jg7067 [Triparma verrucosa]